MASVDEQLIASKQEETQGYDERFEARMNEAKQRAKNNKAAKRSQVKSSKKFKGSIKKKAMGVAVSNPNQTMLYLLLAAMFLDFVNFIGLGSITTIFNWMANVIMYAGGFIIIFTKSSNSGSVANILRGQMWKYAIMPLLEFIPFLSILPFYTGTVIMMWLRVRQLGGAKKPKKEKPEKGAIEMEPDLS